MEFVYVSSSHQRNCVISENEEWYTGGLYGAPAPVQKALISIEKVLKRNDHLCSV